MGFRSKVNMFELERQLKTGKTFEQIGTLLGCSKATVCKLAKKLSLAGAKDLVLSEAASQMNRENIAALHRLNTQATEIEAENRYTLELLKAIDVKAPDKEVECTCPNCGEMVTVKIPDPNKLKDRMALQDRMVKNSAEIRQQLGVIKDVMKDAYDLQQVVEFKQIVMEVIKLESEDCHKRILERIKQRRIAPGFPANGGGTIQ